VISGAVVQGDFIVRTRVMTCCSFMFAISEDGFTVSHMARLAGWQCQKKGKKPLYVIQTFILQYCTLEITRL
jgi:hypothetical protein